MTTTTRSATAASAGIGLRRFDPATNTFGGPTYVEGSSTIDDNSLDYPDSFQDGSGRIQGFATWTNGTSGAVRIVPIAPTPEPLAPGDTPDVTRPDISGASIGDRTLVPGQGTTFRCWSRTETIKFKVIAKKAPRKRARRR
jgi:hypothetical protein